MHDHECLCAYVLIPAVVALQWARLATEMMLMMRWFADE